MIEADSQSLCLFLAEDQQMRTFKSLVALLLIAGVQSASAMLVAEDSRFGDDTLILDTNTGYKWLRLDITSGMSFLDVVTQTADGGLFSGFQTVRQAGVNLLDLFRGNIRSSPLEPQGAIFTFGSTAPATIYDAIQFTNIFGGQVTTNSDGSVRGSLLGNEFMFGPGPCLPLGSCINQGTMLIWTLGANGNRAYAATDVVGGSGSEGRPEWGTWLVAAPTIAAPIPEPSTYALMLAGLMGVGWAVRRRQAGPGALF
ncbi:MAG TPA: PEP-CTERM sorting domain-containing protein [Rhizobacter sp.]|jgi:hypothetical protein|nr:PEP-CTERM sorting domain-containing protein [Rhizobacter sp.]